MSATGQQSFGQADFVFLGAGMMVDLVSLRTHTLIPSGPVVFVVFTWITHNTSIILNSAVRDNSCVTLLSECRLVNSISYLLTVQRVQSEYIVSFHLVKNIQGHRHRGHKAFSPYVFLCFEHVYSSHSVRVNGAFVKYRFHKNCRLICKSICELQGRMFYYLNHLTEWEL